MGPLRHSAAALVALLGLPVLGVALALRPAWRRGLAQRLGFAPRAAAGGLWLHGASVGEAAVGARLATRLLAGGVPADRLFLSATTGTGVEALARAVPAARSGLAPLDHPWCVANALQRLVPRALVLIETELWPSLIACCEAAGVPVVLLSGRISDRSYARYRRLRALIGPTLRRIAWIGARSELDRERFIALGAAADRVRVTGDLKLEAPVVSPRPAADLARVLAAAPLLVAGSTHAGEETALLEALAACEVAGRPLALVLAPRRPERARELRRQVAATGRPVWLRSALPAAPLAPGEVLIVDGLGELPGLYTLAAVGFVGGTLSPVGGHNLLEPLQVGIPVCFGPATGNVREAAQLLEASGAGRRVRDAGELAHAIGELLDDPRTPARVAAGRECLDAQRGALDRSLALLEQVLGGAVAAGAVGP